MKRGRRIAGTLAFVLLLALAGVTLWNPFLDLFHRWQIEAVMNEKLEGHFSILRMRSKDLRRTNSVYIYTPPGYRTSSKRYPVVYLLHGSPGQGRDWFVKGRAQDAAERLILAKRIQPMIVVCADDFGPTGPRDRAEYLNSPRKTKLQAEDYIAHELPAFIDSKFRTIPSPNARALDGLSSGGYGAINIGTRNQRVFHVLASHSGYFDPSLDGKYVKRLLGPKGNALWRANNPHYHAREWRSDPKLRIYMDCGSDDDLFPDNQRLDRELTANHIKHVFYTLDAAHRWSLWRSRLPYSLEYIDKCFKELASS